MTRKDFLVAAAGTAAAFAATTAASAQTPTREEIGSAKNLVEVRRSLERLIDQLQHDQHDFGGWRVRAIERMQAARYDIVQALQWDATHPH